MKQTTLSNGIKVVTEKLSYLRTASFGVWIKVGSAKETKENNGISHMIEHMLFKGTKYRTAKQLADQIAGIGDDVNAFTGKEVTCYYGTTTTENLTTLIELISDMLVNSNLEDEDLRKERRVIYEEIDMYADSADDLVHELLQQNVYKNQALGYIISGTKTNVKSFTRQ
ncbi:MAG: pitrilysin family protein, partial [Clostridiales bacterium]|nr:pitrilysin family protein [Clostridiales bacterium]